MKSYKTSKKKKKTAKHGTSATVTPLSATPLPPAPVLPVIPTPTTTTTTTPSSAPYQPPTGYTPGSSTLNKRRRDDLEESFPNYQASPTDDNIRISAITTPTEQWGISADENVRTQLLRTNAGQFTSAEAEYAYKQRSHQGGLVYKTNSDVVETTYAKPLKKAKTPIAAHTPGLKTQVSPGTTGAIAAEHGTRDALRKTGVETTLDDQQRGDYDVGLVGKAGTLQLLISPAEELDLIKSAVTSGATTIHSVLSDIDVISDPAGFESLLELVQDTRELEKLELASELIRHGRGALVPTEQRQLLNRVNGNPVLALEELRKESFDPSSTFPFNSTLYSQTGRLDQQSLRESHEAAETGQPFQAPLSPTRKLRSKTKKTYFG